MNKRVLFISVTLFVSSFIISCATRKYEAPTLPPAVTELAESLSRRLGITVTADDNLDLYEFVSEWIGTPHRMGGLTKKGVDCSGFVTNLFHTIYDKDLERSSADMLQVNCEKVNKKDLKEGDLVFFWTRGQRSQRPSHVGVYLKDGKFAHSSTSRGVIISKLNEPYYAQRWISGGTVR